MYRIAGEVFENGGCAWDNNRFFTWPGGIADLGEYACWNVRHGITDLSSLIGSWQAEITDMARKIGTLAFNKTCTCCMAVPKYPQQRQSPRSHQSRGADRCPQLVGNMLKNIRNSNSNLFLNRILITQTTDLMLQNRCIFGNFRVIPVLVFTHIFRSRYLYGVNSRPFRIKETTVG